MVKPNIFLDTICGSTARGRILTYLATETESRPRQIARAVNANSGNINRELKRLVKAGIVCVVRKDHWQVVYALDRSCPLFAAIFALATSEELIQPRLTREEWEQRAVRDGWVSIPQFELIGQFRQGKPTRYSINGALAMTGQEWYEKFKEEFGSTYALGDVDHSAYKLAKRDAKKAAGIEK